MNTESNQEEFIQQNPLQSTGIDNINVGVNNNLSTSSSSSFIKNLVNQGTNLLFSSSSSISSPPTASQPTTTGINGAFTFENDMSDGFEILCKKTEIGIEQCKDLLDFFKKRASIEEKYSKNVAEYFSKFKLKDENDSFQKGVSVLHKIGESESTIHQTFSKNLLNNLCHPFNTLIKDMEQKRKNLVNDGQKLRNELKESVELLKKAHLKYEKQCKEMELAKLELIERDIPDSVKVQALERKLAKCESNSILAEEEYKNQLKETNEFITGPYQTRLSENLKEFEQFESMRLQFLKSNVKNYVGLMMEIPLNLECEINGANTSVDFIDPDSDIQNFIKNNCSPKKVFTPFQFETYVEGKKQPTTLNYAVSEPTVASESTTTAPTNSITPSTVAAQPPSTAPDRDLTSVNLSSSPPPPKQSLKENIFGFFNKASNNLKSSTTSLLNKDDGASNLSKSSSSIVGIPTNNPNSIFGIELEELMDRQRDEYQSIEVPIILMQFVQSLLKLNALEKENIFSAVPSCNIQHEKQKLDLGGSVDNINDVYIVATLFKHWLRDLPNPLISYAIYDEIIESPENSWKIIESGIPVLHRKTLHYIIDFLAEFTEPEFVKSSKMDTHSIAVILAPVLIRSPGTKDSPANALQNSKREVGVIESMIVDCFEKRKTNNYFLKKKLPIIQDSDGDDSNNNSMEEDDNQNEYIDKQQFQQQEKNIINSSSGSNNSSGSGSIGSHHHYQYQTTPTNNVTPVLSSASDFDEISISKTNPPRNSSILSFGNSDTFSTNQSDSEQNLVDEDFDILSYK
ncbi:hypothetical protein DICPUDRAFT_155654 [Dictyostelium purpureum]|uniref:Rho-GAP domain-containing protein n=1 Tax=Dictyostelium purpureum TaxID=5786 RepID=F0ZUK4_DICPU|nr:uncharacterized protein DICPUDRAFT_155654 [Dictyostelium purpureum]EGC32366.1 hypothetical protein DICPUDRAFT_155654 [Dictyostelium purpureum]|eukprot:XP_003291096.1 hypothetical protein DICPUDRAFT_155654 [Dictyostelium purpureum]